MPSDGNIPNVLQSKTNARVCPSCLRLAFIMENESCTDCGETIPISTRSSQAVGIVDMDRGRARRRAKKRVPNPFYDHYEYPIPDDNLRVIDQDKKERIESSKFHISSHGSSLSEKDIDEAKRMQSRYVKHSSQPDSLLFQLSELSESTNPPTIFVQGPKQGNTNENSTIPSSTLHSWEKSEHLPNSSRVHTEHLTAGTEYTREDAPSVPPRASPDDKPAAQYGARTIYSESVASVLDPLRRDYVYDLAVDLFNVVSSSAIDEHDLQRILQILPDLLKAFALKLAYNTDTAMYRDISYFIHRHRSSIQSSFADMIPSEKPLQPDGMEPGAFSIGRFLEEAQEEYEQRDVAPQIDWEQPETVVENLEGINPPLDTRLYRDTVKKSAAYAWLIERLQRELILTRAVPDTMDSIRQQIVKMLEFDYKVSRTASATTFSALIQVDWDPWLFMEQQGYTEDPGEALKGAITLTGSEDDAQALSTVSYLCQTWQATGKAVMDLLVMVVQQRTGKITQLTLPEGTEMLAFMDGRYFYVAGLGTSDFLAEIVEQFAWLGAALRTCPPTFNDGIASCKPYIEALSSTRHPFSWFLDRADVQASCVLRFELKERTASTTRLPGKCWHDMFKNPVMVTGFPVLAKSALKLGLEMPLNMMAGLAGSDRAMSFNGNVFIKGYSTMLVATKLLNDLIIWHYLFTSHGERISYLDYPHATAGVNLQQLANARHIVGWASDCQYLAGSSHAKYDVEETYLPPPHAGAFLEKVTISAGKIITGGAIFAVGVNNIPPHLVRQGYIPKLHWLHGKFVVLWDEKDKRGWLVNGTSALLHLVRATLKHYATSAFSHRLLFDPSKMRNSSSNTPESAVVVLTDPNNVALEIWPGRTEVSHEMEIKETIGKATAEENMSQKRKMGFTLFEDLVEDQFTILESMIEHHTRLAGQNGVDLKVRARKHIEGWDFNELATGGDPRPRVATLNALGYGWVDFVRSIGAITLFGSGFGEIITPTHTADMCPNWKCLPTKKYHLAVSMFDMKNITRRFGGRVSGRFEPVQGLIWHCPDSLFGICKCSDQGTRSTFARGFQRHYDPVQVFYPRKSRHLFKTRSPDGLSESGAVVFGHNICWPYTWRDRSKGNGKEEEDLEILPPPDFQNHNIPDSESYHLTQSTKSTLDLSATNESIDKYQSTPGSVPPSLRSFTSKSSATKPDDTLEYQYSREKISQDSDQQIGKEKFSHSTIDMHHNFRGQIQQPRRIRDSAPSSRNESLTQLARGIGVEAVRNSTSRRLRRELRRIG